MELINHHTISDLFALQNLTEQAIPHLDVCAHRTHLTCTSSMNKHITLFMSSCQVVKLIVVFHHLLTSLGEPVQVCVGLLRLSRHALCLGAWQ
jgi:hypothetical protein